MELPDRPAEMDRFWAKVDKTDGCWNWTGSGNVYGTFRFDGESGPAHRFAYERLIGPIPDGLHIDHLCNNQRCVNPAHLEPVTRSENERRKYGDRCKRGHEFTPENTYIRPGRGTRSCKTCQRYRDDKYRLRNQAQ